MDCQSIRRQLDVVRPESQDLEDADFAPVRAHLADCPTCQVHFSRQTRFDQRLGKVFRDVPVPADLKHRLLTRLALTPTSTHSAGSEAVESSPPLESLSPVEAPRASVPRSSELPLAGMVPSEASAVGPLPQPVLAHESPESSNVRRWLSPRLVKRWGMLAASLLLVTASWWWLAHPGGEPVRLAQVDQHLILESPALAPQPGWTHFASGEALRLPGSMLQPRNLSQAVPHRLQIDSRQAAVFTFTVSVKSRGKSSVESAYLVLLPQRAVQPLPRANAFLSGAVEYVGRYCSTAWTEGDLVYVCYVTGGDQTLRRLLPDHVAS